MAVAAAGTVAGVVAVAVIVVMVVVVVVEVVVVEGVDFPFLLFLLVSPAISLGFTILGEIFAFLVQPLR